MKNLRNKNQPPPETAIQTFLSTSWDKVLAVYAKLAEIETLADTITAGDLDGLLSETDIDTIAKLNVILTDATLGDFASQAEAEAGLSNTKTMTPLRVAQAIAVLAAGVQNNYAGAGPPSPADDSSVGYSVGSVWIDIMSSPNESYRLSDPSVGAAIWLKTTLTADELALVALTGDSDDLVEGVNNLLMTATERSRLAAMEDNATADQTPAEIETGYNSQVAVVSQVDAEAGVSADVKRWTPQRVGQAIAALASGGLAWSSANSSIPVVKNTGTMFYALAATVTATLPASPAAGDSLMIVNNDSNALDSYLVQVTAGGSNEITQQNVTSIPQATLTQGQTGLFVCYDAGATKRWHMTKWVSSLDIGSGGGGLIPEFKTANFTAEAGKTYFCDTTAGAIIATLPAGVDAANIVFVDAAGNCSTNPVTINPNGVETIHNDTTFVLDQNFGQVNTAYKAADTNWQVALVGYPEVIVGSGTALEAEIDARVVAVTSGYFSERFYGVENMHDGNVAPAALTLQEPAAAGVKLQTRAFSASTDQRIQITLTVPEGVDVSQPIKWQPVWMTSNTDTGVVTWEFRARPLGHDDAVGQFHGADATPNYCNSAGTGTDNDLVFGSETTFTGVFWTSSSGKKLLSIWLTRRSADVADTYTGTADLVGLFVKFARNAPTDD